MASASVRKIGDDVLEVLSASQMEGCRLVLPGRQLERKLYVAVNDVIEAVGGKWSRKDRAHVFGGEAAEIMEPIILTGEFAKSQDFGFFPTPLDVCSLLLDTLPLNLIARALEPSAGTGSIVRCLKGLVGHIDCYELQEKNCEVLRSIPDVSVTQADFLTVEPRPEYDIVAMNPPFAGQADIHHVLHAAKFLKPGGRLASVMSASVTFRSNRLTTEFRDFVSGRGGEIHRLPDGAFKESGTAVNTCIVSFTV